MENKVVIPDWTLGAPAKETNDSVRPGGGRMKWCTAGFIAGEWHRYPSGTGQLIPWDVMGDSRHELEVCPRCASHSEEN